jgi:hypothetical protein
MGKNRPELSPLRVLEEGANLVRGQRSGEPLHVVFDENLHCRTAYRASPLNRGVHTAADRHVRPEENFSARL